MQSSIKISGTLSGMKRSDVLKLFELTSYLADIQSDAEQDDFLMMYLSKVRDWREDYQLYIGDKGGKKTPPT